MIINELADSSKRFKQGDFKKHEEKFAILAQEGQNPKILFITCCDSRVLPNLITGTDPGDLFVVRNIGNFVAPSEFDESFHSTAAAIEYAVSVLEVSDIIVCGHSQCGAIAALYYEEEKLSKPELKHVKQWLELGKGAKEMAELRCSSNCTHKEKLEKTEKISASFQIGNLLTYPAVRKRVSEKTLFLHAWHYDIMSGTIYYYDNNTLSYLPLNE